jgi:predicted esterase
MAQIKPLTKALFPASLDAEIIPRKSLTHQTPPLFRLTLRRIAPGTDTPVNVLILLHGLGDTPAPFARFARSMALPETVCVALRGPSPLPFDLGGFHWGDDIVFDRSQESMEVDAGFERATRELRDVVERVLVRECGYAARNVLAFGFGQGGFAALALAAAMGREELGGVVCVGGAIPAGSVVHVSAGKLGTPVILCKGKWRSAVDDDAVDRLRETFGFVEVHEWRKEGDGMPANREEMLPIMRFLARRLQSKKGVPEGSVEIK